MKSLEDGFFGLGSLTIVFVALKLTGLIDWEWAWVFSPVWLPAAALLVVGSGAVFIAAIIALSLGTAAILTDPKGVWIKIARKGGEK